MLFPFPYDRKLPALPALAPGSPTLENLLGTAGARRGSSSYAAEQSAAAACVDDGGRVLAYAKVQRDDGERRGTEALAGQDAVRVPRELARAGDVLLLEALEGRRLDHLDGDLDAPAARARTQPSAACTRWPLDLAPLRAARPVAAGDRRRRDRARAAGRGGGRRAAAGEARRARGGPARGDAARRREPAQRAPARRAARSRCSTSSTSRRARPRPTSARCWPACSRPRAAPRGRGRAAARLRRGGARRRTAPHCAGTPPPRCWRGSRCPPSAASARARSRSCARCSTPGPGSARMKPALLFYCQHSVGLGHLMRSYALCERLAERFRVVLLCGGELPEGIAPPEDVELIPLPPLGVEPGRGLRQRRSRATRPSARGRSASERILGTLRDVAPAVVLVELFPFGRAKFARELVPLLEAARAARRVHRLQPARHPRQRPRRPARPRRPRPRARRRPARRRARPLRPALRAARGDVQADAAAVRARPLHGLRRRPRRRRRRASAATTSSSPPAAAASARR